MKKRRKKGERYRERKNNKQKEKKKILFRNIKKCGYSGYKHKNHQCTVQKFLSRNPSVPIYPRKFKSINLEKEGPKLEL